MNLLAIERELLAPDPAAAKALLRGEAAAVLALKQQGVVRDIWFTAADRRAVILLECAGEEEARRHLASLPLVRAGVIAFDVTALRRYDGFDRLE